MASYRAHLAAGGATAAAGAAALSAFTPITDAGTLSIIFGLTFMGSLLPDFDSDSGVPFYFVFGTFTLAALTYITREVLLRTSDLHYRIGIPIAALALIWFVFGGVVKNITNHRGMFHSIPALLIAALGTVLLADALSYDPVHAVLFGAAVGLGFLSHLLLDELHSIVDFQGLPFIPNKAFGSALKFWSPSLRASLFCYALLAVLAYAALPTVSASIGPVSPYLFFLQ